MDSLSTTRALTPPGRAAFYSGHRDSVYQRMRQASEAWYTANFNTEVAPVSSYEVRRRTLGRLLRRHLSGRQIRVVLDYGGERGDLVRGLLDGAKAFVYEISGIPAVEGVTSTADPVGVNADLIINSNVLEHVGFPGRLVEEMLKAAPAKGLVFVEVPCESPFGFSRIARRIAHVGLVALAHPHLALSVVRPASLYLMHEHVNYFTEQS